MKQHNGYEPYLYDDNGVWRAHAAKEGTIVIYDLTEYEFSVTGQVGDSDIIENRNEFKKFRGIVGFLTDSDGDPLVGVEVTIVGNGESETFTTDSDGFYGWNYFHRGKGAWYTVTFGAPVNDNLDVYLKAGRFAEASYQIS